MKQWIKEQLRVLVKYPPVPLMSMDNVYAYLDALYQKRRVSGPIMEVGCADGGMTATACRFLSRIGSKRRYYCVDTFGGFESSHLQTDHRLGLTAEHDRLFGRNSPAAFRGKLERWGIRQNVTIVVGDICKLPDNELPDSLSVVLMDVDLRDPTYVGLSRAYNGTSIDF